jgi:SAM-dependent methyltransferase
MSTLSHYKMSRGFCRLCAEGRSQPWFVAKGYSIGRCSVCGFAQSLDVPTPEALGHLYSGLHETHSKYRSPDSAMLENKRRLTFMRQHVTPGSRILDAGCATGDFLELAMEKYITCGMDISVAAIQAAEARLPSLKGRLAAQSLESMDSRWKDLDAICLWDVIEHVADPLNVVTGMMERLRPGGHLLLSTPDIGALVARVMRAHWAFMIPPLHLGFFSRSSFTYLFDKLVPADIVAYETRGKTVALAFLLYKINQMSALLAPQWLIDRVAGHTLGQLNIPVPTNDIAYVCIRKRLSYDTPKVFGG